MQTASPNTELNLKTSLIVGNWKCHTRTSSALNLAKELRQLLGSVETPQVVICPPFVYLSIVSAQLEGSNIGLGAQDVHWQDDAAATGEVSPEMLVELVDYVIIGHSERRHQFGEGNEVVNRKLGAALAAHNKEGRQLQPILCLGETRQEREAGQTKNVLLKQLRSSLAGLQPPTGFIVAYEPVWAIGAGVPATAELAAEAITIIRDEAAALLGTDWGQSLRALYGGSVDQTNVIKFLSRPEIDGALVGSASLVTKEFTAIIEGARQAKIT